MKWRDMAEHQIQKARAEGKLDNLKGQGEPLPRRKTGDIVSSGMAMMAEAGVLPREIELKKEADRLLKQMKDVCDPVEKKALSRRLADVQMRLAIEQEARRRFFRNY